MTLAQKFQVTPKDIVMDGAGSYIGDPATGNVNYQAWVKAGYPIFNRTMPFAGVFKLDPLKFKSTSWAKGDVLMFGAFHLEVISIDSKKATCKVSVMTTDIQETGTLIVDLSKDYISIVSIAVNGKADGYDFPLTLTPIV